MAVPVPLPHRHEPLASSPRSIFVGEYDDPMAACSGATCSGLLDSNEVYNCSRNKWQLSTTGEWHLLDTEEPGIANFLGDRETTLNTELTGSFTGRVHGRWQRGAHSALVLVATGLLFTWLTFVSKHQVANKLADGNDVRKISRFSRLPLDGKEGERSPRVYVYDLPPRFNYDLLRCRFGKSFKALNEGYGKYNGKLQGVPLYATDQRYLEPLVHGRLLAEKYGKLVTDPHEADLFYVPYYAYAAFQCLRSPGSFDVPKDLKPFEGKDARKLEEALFIELSKTPWLERRGGKDHITVVAGIGREITFGALLDGVHIAAKSGTRHWTMGTLETVSPTFANQPVANVIALPYPSGLHCSSAEHCGIENGQNDAPRSGPLALFIGDPERSPARQVMVPNLQKYPSKALVYPPAFTQGFLTRNRFFFELMANSTFCLEPGGDSPTRKGFYDAVLAGCIPVIFGSNFLSSLPFASRLRLPFDKFGLMLPTADRTMETLMKISEAKIAELRTGCRHVAWQLNYAAPDAKEARGDAIDLFLHEAAFGSQHNPHAAGLVRS